MKRLVLAAALAVACAPALAAQDTTGVRRITIARAVELSLRAQPTMVQARQDVRVADAQERQALAAFLPSLSANASTSTSGGNRVNQFGVPTSVSSYYSSSMGVTLNWDVFTGLRRGAQRSAARATSDQRDATLARQQYATVLATQQAFFQVLADADLVTVAQTRLRSADEQLKLTTERLRLGATTRSDSLRAQVAYGQAQLALITAQNNLFTAQANLARQVQVDGLAAAVPDSSLFARLGPLDTVSLRREALERAPSVLEADAAVAAARSQRNAKRSAYLPTMSLSLGNTWASGAPSVNDPFGGRYASGWSARFNISYPLFNNLTREVDLITTDASLQGADARARDARLALSASLTQYLSALAAAAGSIDVGTINVAASQEDLRMQRERYRLGAVTIIEVLQSQANLDQAQVDLVQARYNYLVARAQIEALVGHSL
jgi:outer membrane protein TolC